MNTGNLILLTVLALLMLLMIERTEPKRRWITVLLLILPAIWLYRWAGYRGQTTETLIGVGVGAALFLVYWLAWGLRHRPQSSDSIHVVGMDDEK